MNSHPSHRVIPYRLALLFLAAVLASFPSLAQSAPVEAISREISITLESAPATTGSEAISREISLSIPSQAPGPAGEAISRELSIRIPSPEDATRPRFEGISREVTLALPAVGEPPRPSAEAISRELTLFAATNSSAVRLPQDFASGSFRFESIADTRPTNPDRAPAADVNALSSAGTITLGTGASAFTGPAYQNPPDALPSVQLDSARQLTVLHPGPGSRGASAGIPLGRAGRYLIQGRFARAHEGRGLGNGVSVAILRNLDTTNLLFTASVSSDHPANPSAPFAGTSRVPFSVVAEFVEGDVLRCVVFSGSSGNDTAGDVTALELLAVALEDAPPFFASSKPVLVVSPEDASVQRGSSAYFDCVALGATPLQYRWFHNDREISGATGPTLTVANATPQDAGRYFVTVRNSVGETSSTVANLKVTPRQGAFRGLGFLPGGTQESDAVAVSDDGGVVVGNASSARGPEGFVWKDGAMGGIGFLPDRRKDFSQALGVSGDGLTVVGYGSSTPLPGSSNYDWEGFTWKEGVMQSLGVPDGPLVPGGPTYDATYSIAYAASRDGSFIVGQAFQNVGGRPCFWDSGVGKVLFVLEPDDQALAWSVSADGRVMTGRISGSPPTAALWRDGVPSRIPELSPGTRPKISADGRVIVGTGLDALANQAVRWESGTVEPLGDLPGGDLRSEATGTSADGSVIVGWGTTDAGTEAFLWDRTAGLRSLRSHLASELGVDLAGWQLLRANDISADGSTVVGQGLNPDGKLEAWVVRIKASGAPVILGQPVAASVVAGQPVTFTVNALSETAATYRWYRDGNLLVGETANQLTLASVKASDAGAYSVSVGNAAGRILSTSARLDVLIPPKIVEEPQPYTAKAGESALFTVRAQGTEPLSYEWRFNGTPLGAPNLPTLQLVNLAIPNAGQISVRVTNAVGTATSGSARLRVIEPGRLAQPLPSLSAVDLDGELILKADVAGTPPFTYQWRLNGQDIRDRDASGPELRISPIRLQDAGIYTVIVANEAGAITGGPAEVRVRVTPRPGNDVFAQATDLTGIDDPVTGTNTGATREPGEKNHASQPGHQSVWYRWTPPQDGSVTFRTVGSAFDTLLAAYTGTRVDQLTEIASNDDATDGAFFASEVRFSVQRNTPYFLAVDGLGDDAGNYVLSWNFEPRVALVPRITRHPDSVTRLRGQPVTLSVDAENATDVTWEFNGRPLTGVSGSQLNLGPLTPEDVGTYVAAVRGNGGTVFSHPAVVEIGPQPDVRSYDKPAARPASQIAPSPIARQAEGGFGLLLSPGRPVEQWVNNEVNTTQREEANHCGRLTRRTGYLLLEVEKDGQLVINVTNTAIPLVLALYSFSDPDQSLACGDNNRLVLADARAGRIYSLVFGSAADLGGVIGLSCVSGTPPPVIENPPTTTAVEPGRGVTLRAPRIEGLEPVARYQWYRNGRKIEGAVGEFLQLEPFQPEMAGDYSVVLDNEVGRTEYQIGSLAADLPLLPAAPSESVPGVFTFRLTGNPGQRVAVEQGSELGVWNSREEFWLPAGGQEYRDEAMASRSSRLFHLTEVPLTIAEDVPLEDGRRTWRISGGRIGDRYVLEQSLNGTQWTPIRTNRVEVGPFLHVEPAGFNASLRSRRAE
ncbi:MAG: immunoglobulin domain-containing protein [Verrucomicrobiales bacterium]|nr:immunoglobulin domain-containing protein [Verrucomicrobiales bacterium]